MTRREKRRLRYLVAKWAYNYLRDNEKKNDQDSAEMHEMKELLEKAKADL